jgi:membrane protein
MKRLFDLLVATAVRFNANDGWAHASHIALSMLMALFPFCIFSLSLAGQLSADLSIPDLVEFVFGAWPDEVAEPIEREIAAVLETSGTASLTLNGFLAIFFASNGVDAVRAAISDAYRETDPRPFWKTRLLCVAFVVFGGLALSIAGILTVAVPVYFHFVQAAAPNIYTQLFSSEPLRVTLTVALLLFLLIACHLWLPGLRHPLRRLMPGISLTLVLWFVCAQVFSFYIKNVASYSVTYAGLAGIMASLVFMYLMAAVFILGAEFNGILARTTNRSASDV